MEILFCIVGAAVFWLVIMPAMNISGAQSRQEEDDDAFDRLTKL